MTSKEQAAPALFFGGVYVRWLMFCLVSVPFVVPFRWYPDGDFFSDAIAVFFALLFVIASKELRCSPLVLIGFALAGLILVAGVLGGSAYMEAWLAPALMVLVGSLFLGSVQARDPAELQRDWDAVLYGLALGGGYSLVLGLGQIFEWEWVRFLTFDGAIGVVANIGGRNQFSLYVLLGFLAFLVLLVRSALSVRWRCAVVVVVASLCSFVLVSSGSRSVVLMVFSVLVLAIFRLYFWRNDRFSYYFLIFSGVFFLVQLVSVVWPDYFPVANGGGSGLLRVRDAYADTRWVEWAKAWSIFLEHPFGVGFGNYAFFSFAAAQMPSLVWSNPHNVILHFLVETGFIGAALIVFGFVVAAVGCFKYLRMAEGGVILPAAIGSFILHNLLEYSFWYANFFLCFLIFLAFLPTTGRVLRFVGGRVVSLVFLVLLLVSVVQYCRLLSVVWLPDSKSRVARIVVSAQVGLNPFLSWRADKVFMDFIPYDDGPDLVVRFCRLEDMARREPLPQYLERMAFLAMIAGDNNLAGGILMARYRRLSDTSGYYFESAVKAAWPLAAERVIRDFKERKLEGFKSYEEYRLGESGVCDGV